MSENSIKCPKCGEIIPLSEALSYDIEERARQKFEIQLTEKEAEYQSRLKKQREELEAKLKKQTEETVSAKEVTAFLKSNLDMSHTSRRRDAREVKNENIIKNKMKKILQFLAIALAVFAAFLTWLSNTDYGKNMYKNICQPKLSSGINKLFQNPNKYRNPKVKQRHVSKLNFFYLQEDKDVEFEAIKNFILSNFYTRKLDYKVKCIVQYQAAQVEKDAWNLNFVTRPIFFIKETENNRNIDFSNSSADEMMKDKFLITTEHILTQNLDTFLGNGIRTIVLFMLIITAALNSICLFFKENNKR